jgi:hypothetical protein
MTTHILILDSTTTLSESSMTLHHSENKEIMSVGYRYRIPCVWSTRLHFAWFVTEGNSATTILLYLGQRNPPTDETHPCNLKGGHTPQHAEHCRKGVEYAHIRLLSPSPAPFLLIFSSFFSVPGEVNRLTDRFCTGILPFGRSALITCSRHLVPPFLLHQYPFQPWKTAMSDKGGTGTPASE